MERKSIRLPTWFPNPRWARLWRSPKGDAATSSAPPSPVGYLVNHPGGLTGVQGGGYDYVLGAGGIYVQAQSAQLLVRVPVASGSVRGLAPVTEKFQLTHGLIPAYLFALGLRWFQEDPGHRAILRRGAGTGTPTGRWCRSRRAPPRPSPTGPLPVWWPSSTPTEGDGPSSPPPTTKTSRAS